MTTGTQQVDIFLPSTAGDYSNGYALRVPPVQGSWEFRARLRVHSGATTSGDVAQLIAYGAGGTTLAGVNIRGDDTVIAVPDLGAGTAVAVAGIRGGQGWARVRVIGGGAQFDVGIGSGGEPPTSWTSVGAAGRNAFYIGYGESLRLAANRGTPTPGDFTVAWGDLYWRSIDL